MIGATPFELKIAEIISPSVESLGYDLVRVKYRNSGGNTLQIMAERKSDKALGLEDCTKISHTVSALLDVEDPISDEYNLEVSSPGMDRPLTQPKDFAEYAGNRAKIALHSGIDNRKRFKGELIGPNEDNTAVLLQLADQEEPVELPFDLIDTASLVIDATKLH